MKDAFIFCILRQSKNLIYTEHKTTETIIIFVKPF